jgi:hypothetical protein
MSRNTLCSGELGSHHGLPVTVIDVKKVHQ